jgi:hypothetical protein
MAWAPRMDESLNPDENEDPEARLGHFSFIRIKKAFWKLHRRDGWRCSNNGMVDLFFFVCALVNRFGLL